MYWHIGIGHLLDMFPHNIPDQVPGRFRQSIGYLLDQLLSGCMLCFQCCTKIHKWLLDN